MTLEDIARRAVDGDRDALDTLVRGIQDDVYGLSLRMLWNREDAEDATQEILVRVVTRLGMLQCLDRPHRLAYVLGEIFGLAGPEAAEALAISPELFRKRLQHARSAIASFTRAYCGLVSDTAACACHRRVRAALRAGRARADDLAFAATPSSFQEARTLVRQVDTARRALAVHRTSQPRGTSVDFARRLAQAIGDAPSPLRDSRSTRAE